MTNFNQAKAEQVLKRPLPDLLDELALYDDTVRGAGEVRQKVAAIVLKRGLDNLCGCP